MKYNINNNGFALPLIGSVVALIVGIILFVAVLVPITTTTVARAGNTSAYLPATPGNNSSYWATSFSGTNATIANSLITFILIGILVIVAGLAIMGIAK